MKDIDITQPNDDGITATWADGVVVVQIPGSESFWVPYGWDTTLSHDDNVLAAWDVVIGALQGL